jgi:hypothetical protein
MLMRTKLLLLTPHLALVLSFYCAQKMWTQWAFLVLGLVSSANGQTTTVTTTTPLECVASLYQGPIAAKRGKANLELVRPEGDILVEECAGLCEANSECAGFSHRACYKFSPPFDRDRRFWRYTALR